MTKTPAQRIKDYRERQKKAGLKEVKVWVPVALRAKLQAYAKRLCKSET